MAQGLSRHAQLSTVGLIGREVFGKLEPRDDAIGLDHEFLLWDRRPELWHRWASWRQLRRFYIRKTDRDGVPDVLLVRNMQPIFNRFVRWVRRQKVRPLIVLVLADSGSLGQKVRLWRRIRYAFKPMVTSNDAKVLPLFDACISLALAM